METVNQYLTAFKDKHCLILGAHGQVGRALCAFLSSQSGAVLDVPELMPAEAKVVALSRQDLDVSDLKALENRVWFIHAQRPLDYLLNAVAYTAVDTAETEQQLADVINHQVPKLLAILCSELGIKLVHYSTDYVYPGVGVAPYVESSRPDPVNVYGRTKLAGDNAVLEAAPDAIIGRTSWVYDKHGRNFLTTMQRLAQTKDELRVVDDQIGAPTSADFVAAMSLQLAAAGRSGVFHLVPSGHISWAGFAREVFRFLNKKVEVHGITSEEYPTAAQRPCNSRLSNQKLARAIGKPIPSWQEVLYTTLNN